MGEKGGNGLAILRFAYQLPPFTDNIIVLVFTNVDTWYLVTALTAKKTHFGGRFSVGKRYEKRTHISVKLENIYVH